MSSPEALRDAQYEGYLLRYPESLGIHAQITYDNAISMLLRAVQLSQHTPFAWGYIDKPTEGQLFLTFRLMQLPEGPIDGIVYQDREQKSVMPAGNGRELEVREIKFGFIPGVDQAAFRVRRSYRMHKGGHPQLVLIHYSRGQAIPIVPSIDMPTRNYPLRNLNEPPVYVMGERQGQKVLPNPAGMSGQVPIPPPGNRALNYGMPGMGMPANPQAMLAQQNSNMDVLARRAQRDRGASMNQRAANRMIEEDDSADENETISTRTLALTRYRRNHEYMNEVFMHAAFGDRKAPSLPSPYAMFKLSDLEDKVAKLNAEVEELKNKSAARKEAAALAANELRDVPMDGLAISEPISS